MSLINEAANEPRTHPKQAVRYSLYIYIAIHYITDCLLPLLYTNYENIIMIGCLHIWSSRQQTIFPHTDYHYIFGVCRSGLGVLRDV